MVKVLPLLEMLPAAHKRHRRMLHVWRFVGHTCSMRSHEAWLWKRERMRHEAWLWRRELAELLEGRQLPQRHLLHCSAQIPAAQMPEQSLHLLPCAFSSRSRPASPRHLASADSEALRLAQSSLQLPAQSLCQHKDFHPPHCEARLGCNQSRPTVQASSPPPDSESAQSVPRPGSLRGSGASVLLEADSSLTSERLTSTSCSLPSSVTQRMDGQ